MTDQMPALVALLPANRQARYVPFEPFQGPMLRFKFFFPQKLAFFTQNSASFCKI
jgi:hypothetical protein